VHKSDKIITYSFLERINFIEYVQSPFITANYHGIEAKQTIGNPVISDARKDKSGESCEQKMQAEEYKIELVIKLIIGNIIIQEQHKEQNGYTQQRYRKGLNKFIDSRTP
jgi:hypothetical protein